MQTEELSNSKKNIVKKSNKTDIPFIAYFMSFIVFIVPPVIAFVYSFFILDIGKESLTAIFLLFVWACIYKEFVINMKENRIVQDFSSKLMYIFLTTYMTYGIILTCVIKKVFDYGWF